MAIDLINEFFIQPIVNNNGYNIVNTLVFAVIAIIVSFGLLYPWLNKKGIKFNARFLAALIPFVIMAVSVRVLEDQHILARCLNPTEYCFYTYTPGIWIATALIVIVSIFLSWFLSHKLKQDFNLILAGIGILLALPVFVFDLRLIKEFIGPIQILSYLAIAVFVLTKLFNSKIVSNKIGSKLFGSNINKIVLTGQLLDGFATFVALTFPGCTEQHVVTGFLIDTIGLWSFPLIKAIIAIVALYLIDDYAKNLTKKAETKKQKHNWLQAIPFIEKNSRMQFASKIAKMQDEKKNLAGFIKMFIFIIGFAPGARDLLTLALGTCGLL